MYTYVCIYICTHIYMYANIYTHTHTHIYVYIHIYMYIYIYVYIYVYIYICIYLYTYINIYVCVCMYIYILKYSSFALLVMQRMKGVNRIARACRAETDAGSRHVFWCVLRSRWIREGVGGKRDLVQCFAAMPSLCSAVAISPSWGCPSVWTYTCTHKQNNNHANKHKQTHTCTRAHT